MAFGFSKKTGSPSKSDLALMGGAGLAALGGPIAPMILAAMYAGSEDDKKRMAEQEEEKLRENMMRADLAEINRRAASGNPNYQGPRTMEGQLFGRQAMNAEELMGRASPEYAFANAQRKFNPQPMAPKDRYVHIPDVGLVDLADPGGPSTTIEAPKDEGSLVTLVSPDGRTRRTANARSPWARGAMERGWVDAGSMGGQRGMGQVFGDMFGSSVPQGMRPVVGADGMPTGQVEPIPGGEKDPTIIEQQRVAKLKEDFPKERAAFSNVVAEYDKTIALIDEILDPSRTPGLSGATGFGGGAIGDFFTLSGTEAASARGKLKRLEGKSLISGLSNLKSQSATGASGMGALSEREADFVIQSQAALDRAQRDEDYVVSLENYRADLQASKQRLQENFRLQFSDVFPDLSLQQRQPAPLDQTDIPPPQARVRGQVYDTPRGPMQWTGTGWLPAQQGIPEA